ncbi:hypothetical protein LSAT2_022527 [Lamellibrachia satsuma]|nr:hypothetical protein LSAT2_022527 [Lamellibrachia satsuma]
MQPIALVTIVVVLLSLTFRSFMAAETETKTENADKRDCDECEVPLESCLAGCTKYESTVMNFACVRLCKSKRWWCHFFNCVF